MAALAVVIALAWCCACLPADEDRMPGWTGKVKGLAPDLVLDGPEIYKPASVSLGESGEIYVLDAGNYRLYEYSPDGTLQAEVGRSGQGVGEFPFLTDFASHVVAANGAVAVVMGQAQQVNVWDLPDWSVRSFRLNGFSGGATFDGEFLHVILSSAAEPLDGAAVHVYSVEGELVGSYGERRRPDWENTLAAPEFRLFTGSEITMSPSGRVYEAMSMWPTLRAFDDGELVWDRWYDMAWLEGEAIAKIFNRPRSLFDGLTADHIVSDDYVWAYMTIGMAANDESVITLFGGSYAQVYSADGVPGKTYKLFEPGEDPDGSQQYGQQGRRIALSHDGSRLCVADTRQARVLCYTLPRDSVEASTG